MHRFLRHIFCICVLLSVSFLASAQQGDVDEQLNLYENQCSLCLDLRSKAASDGGVLKAEAKALVADFLSLNKELKSREARMTAIQRRRFVAISQWFATGVRPAAEPLDLPRVTQCAEIPTTLPPASYKTELIYIHDLPAQPVLRAKKGYMYILANLAVPDVSCGLMAGYQAQRYGGYISFRSSFTSVSPTYSCTSEGVLNGGGIFWASGGTFWASGEEKGSNMSVCGGVVYGFNPNVSTYVGAGYGSRRLAWEDVDGEWAEVSDLSHKGFAFEAGALFSWKSLAFSLGFSSVSFRTAELVCGVGVKF